MQSTTSHTSDSIISIISESEEYYNGRRPRVPRSPSPPGPERDGGDGTRRQVSQARPVRGGSDHEAAEGEEEGGAGRPQPPHRVLPLLGLLDQPRDGG